MHIHNSYLIKIILTALSAQLVRGYLRLEHDSANKAVSSLCFFSARIIKEIEKSNELLIVHPIEAHTVVVAINDYYRSPPADSTRVIKEINELLSVTSLVQQLVDYQNNTVASTKRVNEQTHSEVIDMIYPIYLQYYNSEFPHEKASYFGT